MVDIQYPTAEIRRGNKRRRRKKKQDENIYGLPYYIGRPQTSGRGTFVYLLAAFARTEIGLNEIAYQNVKCIASDDLDL